MGDLIKVTNYRKVFGKMTIFIRTFFSPKIVQLVLHNESAHEMSDAQILSTEVFLEIFALLS